MYGRTHIGLGWVVGVLAPGSDRRLRAWCAVCAQPACMKHGRIDRRFRMTCPACALK